MSSREVVHTSGIDVPELTSEEYLTEADRYRSEAQDPNLNPIVAEMKLDTAEFMSKQAFRKKIAEYAGEAALKHL